MAFEIITLNLIPDGEMPVFHASQFDTARPVIIDLVMGEDAYVVPEGITLELHCRKVDDTIVTMEADEVSENRVTFVTTEQLTACIGDNLCEVALLNGDDHIGTLNFILHVEPDPLAGGLTSESDIYNLTQQIEDIAQEVIGEDYYDKTEVDALLADKADISDLPDMSNYYTKSETYSSGQIDYSMNLKADKSELDDYALKTWVTTNFVTPSYLGTYYYNKLQVDALLYNMLPEGTADGAIASFNTEIAGNLTALKCTMLASGGGGTPDNPIPIVPFTECNITNEDGEGNVIDEITIDLGGTRYGGYIDVNNGKLVVTHEYLDLGSLDWYISGGRFQVGMPSGKYANPTSGNGIPWNMICDCFVTKSWNAGTSGSFDNVIFGLSNGQTLGVVDTSYNDASVFKTDMSGHYIAYELATPIEIDISPEHLYANVGQNNVFHDCNGTTEVKYKDTIQHYIDTRL